MDRGTTACAIRPVKYMHCTCFFKTSKSIKHLLPLLLCFLVFVTSRLCVIRISAKFYRVSAFLHLNPLYHPSWRKCIFGFPFTDSLFSSSVLEKLGRFVFWQYNPTFSPTDHKRDLKLYSTHLKLTFNSHFLLMLTQHIHLRRHL